MTYLVGDVLRLRVTATSSDGSGIARGNDGMVLFLPGALPGEEVSARVTVRKREYAIAEVAEILLPNPGRGIPFCRFYGECGGCQLQHCGYPLQLELKKAMVTDAFKRIYKRPFPDIHPCLASPLEREYRNKAAMPVRKAGTGAAPGFFARRSHSVVPVDSCPVLAPSIDAALSLVARELPRLGITSYDERVGRGRIRHVVLRQGVRTGDVLLSLVLNGSPAEEERRKLSGLIPILREGIPGLRSVTVNQNSTRGNVILGQKSSILFGDGLIEERLGPFSFLYDTTSFFQINPMQAENIYEHVACAVAEEGASNVLELYSGIGTMTAFLASKGVHVTAVEEWLPAVDHMRRNMERNALEERVTVLSGPVEKHIGSLRKPVDVVVLDPPRTGCSKSVLQGLLDLAPRTIMYVSCNPATLARDCTMLSDGGYRVGRITCFDMFPQTSHVECVVLITRVKD
ncbi:MAG TPA: 23S rRNA (uracil(1939)-C(5))-methyltransferase RlmD [Synergistaceae bacterium]|nr:23S rRNA (uracil(1939)-C(5))-methyltransferase RlmD [Synergistaceae bacterium]